MPESLQRQNLVAVCPLAERRNALASIRVASRPLGGGTHLQLLRVVAEIRDVLSNEIGTVPGDSAALDASWGR
jgi:hypothetical protein